VHIIFFRIFSTVFFRFFRLVFKTWRLIETRSIYYTDSDWHRGRYWKVPPWSSWNIARFSKLRGKNFQQWSITLVAICLVIHQRMHLSGTVA